MSNDLEDFLRRAAQKRHAGEVARREEKSRPPRRPLSEYSDARSERVIRPSPEEAEEVILAEVVPTTRTTVQTKPRRQASNSRSQGQGARSQGQGARGHQQASPQAGSRGDAVAAAMASMGGEPTAPMQDEAHAADTGQQNTTAKDLVQMLRSPQGIRQAFLLREIIDRPEHRW
ncbi:MAG: hypothetical protein AAF958_10705 [Planctomycetota bacterium]